MTGPLPALVDRKQLAAETGQGRAFCDAVFRQLEVVSLPGLRKTYVRRADVEHLLQVSTYDGSRVRP
jgi:hypothetical protein